LHLLLRTWTALLPSFVEQENKRQSWLQCWLVDQEEEEKTAKMVLNLLPLASSALFPERKQQMP
jgi:hypothetical protein